MLAEPLEGSESEDEIRKQFSQAVPRESNLPEANPPEANLEEGPPQPDTEVDTGRNLTAEETVGDTSGSPSQSSEANASTAESSGELDIQTPSQSARKILLKFKTWLCSFDGGIRDYNSASQHVKQVYPLWSRLSRDFEVSDSIEVKRVKKWTRARVAAKDLSEGIILSYTSSLGLWAKFLE